MKTTKTKQECLEIVALVSSYSLERLTKLNCYLDEDEIGGESDNFAVEVEDIRGSEGDGAEMFMTLKIIDKETSEETYIEFSGRYSSWDSSSYYNSYIVEPYQEMVTFYRPVK